MIFAVEQTLGSLAKWLRFLGFEVHTWYRQPPPPRPGVIVVRRSWPKPGEKKRQDTIHLQADELEAQLQSLQQLLPWLSREAAPGQRCSRCNSLLRPLAATEVEDRVPEYVRYRFQEFYECPRCQKVYWPGSHLQKIKARLSPWMESQGQPDRKE